MSRTLTFYFSGLSIFAPQLGQYLVAWLSVVALSLDSPHAEHVYATTFISIIVLYSSETCHRPCTTGTASTAEASFIASAIRHIATCATPHPSDIVLVVSYISFSYMYRLLIRSPLIGFTYPSVPCFYSQFSLLFTFLQCPVGSGTVEPITTQPWDWARSLRAVSVSREDGNCPIPTQGSQTAGQGGRKHTAYPSALLQTRYRTPRCVR